MRCLAKSTRGLSLGAWYKIQNHKLLGKTQINFYVLYTAAAAIYSRVILLLRTALLQDRVATWMRDFFVVYLCLSQPLTLFVVVSLSLSRSYLFTLSVALRLSLSLLISLQPIVVPLLYAFEPWVFRVHRHCKALAHTLFCNDLII